MIFTAQAVRASGLRTAGWIANGIDPAMAHVEENLATLRCWLAPASCLGVIPRLVNALTATTASCLNLDVIQAALESPHLASES